MANGGLFAHERCVLAELAAAGYRPQVIYDIGASNGVWSECISAVAPDASFHLFEPLCEIVEFYKRDLQDRSQRLKNFNVHPIALGETNGNCCLFVTHDGWGSSLHDRGDIPEVRERVTVPVYRLDDYAAEKNLPPPDVMKIDSQGGERVILNGAARLLQEVNVLFLETWFDRGYGPNTPLIGEIIDQLRGQGFSLVELGEKFFDAKHRLYSVDAFFFSERLMERFWLPSER